VVAIKPAGYQQNLQTHTAVVDRLSSQGAVLLPDAVGGLRPVGGLRAPGDLTLTAIGGMVVRLGPGIAYVPQGQSAIAGAYSVPNDGNMDFTVPTAHATLARRDLIVARVQDSFYAGAAEDDDFIYLSGTAASTPVDPTPPAGASYTILWRIAVAPAAAAIVVGNLTQIAYAAPRIGSPMPISPTDVTPGIYAGQYRDHPTFGQQRWTGAAWGPPEVLPRVTARRTTVQSIPGTVGAVIAFDAVSTRSTPGMWSVGTPSRMIAPETGEYDLSWHMPWAASPNPGAQSTQMRYNGILPSGGGLIGYLDARPNQVYYGSEVTGIIRGLELNANDYVEIYGVHNTDANRNVAAGARATLSLVRR
jgi:hypothetical protein